MKSPTDSTAFEQYAQIVDLPPQMRPYSHLAAHPEEISLVAAMGRKAWTRAEIAGLMGTTVRDRAFLSALARLHTRAILKVQLDGTDSVSHDSEPRYVAASFYRRLTYLSMQDYAGWQSVSEEDRAPILAWHLEENIKHHDLPRRLAQLRTDPHAAHIHNRDFILLEEALEMVDAASFFVVVPCDCRTTVMACDLPRWDTCLRLDERGRRTLEEGEGRIVSQAECRDIVKQADQVGLMHTGQRAEHGRPAILNGNCCACCSYPIRAGVALGMDKLWPQAHYLAERDLDRCNHCGTCAERCFFDAFFTTPAGEVGFDWEQCHGCGLCATGCTRSAIKMAPLIN